MNDLLTKKNIVIFVIAIIGAFVMMQLTGH